MQLCFEFIPSRRPTRKIILEYLLRRYFWELCRVVELKNCFFDLHRLSIQRTRYYLTNSSILELLPENIERILKLEEFMKSVCIWLEVQMRITNSISSIISFISVGKMPTRTVVDIEYKSRSGKSKVDPSKHLNKEDLPSLEDQLKAIEDSVADIGREIDFARRQEVLLKEAGGTLVCLFWWCCRCCCCYCCCFCCCCNCLLH